MAVKASAHITLNSVVDIAAYYRYYLLQSATLSTPSKPTSYPPSSSWVDAEPAYTSGSTNSLYFVDCTVFSDGGYSYSDVSLSSSYEASKEAYNKATAAQSAASNAQSSADSIKTDLANNYYTKIDADYQIQASEEAIINTVSSTYATKTELGAVDEVTGDLVSDMESILGDGTVDNPGLLNTLQAQVELTSEEWSASFTKTETAIGDISDKVVAAQNDISEYSTWFTMDENALTISKTVDGVENPLKVQLDNNSLDFLDGETTVAYISNEKLMINAAEVEGTLDVGEFRWTARDNGNMGLMWIGG